MILIKDIHDLIDFVIDKSNNKPQRRADVDLAVYEASLSLFREELEKYEANANNAELMADFIKVEPFSAYTTFGTFTKPTDYERYQRIETKTGVGVSIIKSHAWNSAANHPVKPPSADYPIATISEKILVRPTTINITLYYFKTPQKPSYVESNGVYSPTLSINLEWKPSMFYVIVNRALSKLGINLKDDQLIQYSEMKR